MLGHVVVCSSEGTSLKGYELMENFAHVQLQLVKMKEERLVLILYEQMSWSVSGHFRMVCVRECAQPLTLRLDFGHTQEIHECIIHIY